jgi:hypothetical protein
LRGESAPKSEETTEIVVLIVDNDGHIPYLAMRNDQQRSDVVDVVTCYSVVYVYMVYELGRILRPAKKLLVSLGIPLV